MRAQVSKWGNSLAIRLPKAAAASLNVCEGQAVDLSIEGDAVVIRSSRPRYSIEELVAQMRPGNEPEPIDNANIPPVGGELL
jgi:antitoxin MazE